MRLEYKFLIDNEKLDDFRSLLLKHVTLDKYTALSGKNEYTVRSIYYDTIRLRFYYEKIEGIKVRKKVRIRGYNEYEDKSHIFLEIKRKFNGHIYKNRSKIHYSELGNLLSNHEPVEIDLQADNNENEESAGKFLFNLRKGPLLPVLLVVYEREAYFSNNNSLLRITIDKNLRSSLYPAHDTLFKEEKMADALEGKSIIEVKFLHGYPSWLSKLLTEFGLVRRSLSKYVICLDSHKTPLSLIKGKLLNMMNNSGIYPHLN